MFAEMGVSNLDPEQIWMAASLWTQKEMNTRMLSSIAQLGTMNISAIQEMAGKLVRENLDAFIKAGALNQGDDSGKDS